MGVAPGVCGAWSAQSLYVGYLCGVGVSLRIHPLGADVGVNDLLHVEECPAPAPRFMVAPDLCVTGGSYHQGGTTTCTSRCEMSFRHSIYYILPRFRRNASFTCSAWRAAFLRFLGVLRQPFFRPSMAVPVRELTAGSPVSTLTWRSRPRCTLGSTRGIRTCRLLWRDLQRPYKTRGLSRA